VLSGVNKAATLPKTSSTPAPSQAHWKATILGIQVFALSQEFSIETRHAPLWDTALKFGRAFLRKVIDAGVPKNTVINVNFPACTPDQVKGIRVTRQGKAQSRLPQDRQAP